MIGDPTTTERLLVGGWAQNPRLFLREALESPEPWDRQAEIADSIVANRTTNVVTGHAVGKDWICGRLALWWLYTQKDSIVVTTAPKELQVRTILWGEIRAAFQAAPVALGGELNPVSPELKIGPRWYAIGLTARDPNAFAGFHGLRVLLIRDEAAGILPLLWEAGKGVTSGDDDRILNIGNPVCGPVHPFAKEAAMQDEPGVRRTIWIRSTETPNYVQARTVIPGLASRAFVKDIADVYGTDSVVYGARVLARFPGGAADGLISLEHLALARERANAGVKPADGDVVRLGCDVARFGDDLTRICANRGPIAWQTPESPLSKMDNVAVAEACASAAHRTKAASIAIDGGGLGSGPIDILRAWKKAGITPAGTPVNPNLQIIEVQFGAKASEPERWKDVRTELWWRMRDWFIERGALDPDQTLEEELLAPRYEQKGTWIQMEPKDEFKKRLGMRSPDYADALALSIAGHVGRQSHFTKIDLKAPNEEARRSFLAEYRARR